MIGRNWRLAAAVGASVVGISLFGSPAYAYETVSGDPVTCDPGLEVTITTIVSTGTTTHRWTYAGVPLAASWGIGAYHKTFTGDPYLDSWSAETTGKFVSAVAACEPRR